MAADLHRRIENAGGLVGLSSLAARWGVSRQRVAQLAAERSFPKRLPGDVVAWLGDDCDRWRAENFGRRKGKR